MNFVLNLKNTNTMNKMFFSILPIAISMMTISALSDPLAIGSSIPSPESKMKDISGKEIAFKDAMKKNGLLVMFSCNTCPVVKKYQSRTLETGKFAIDNEIGVIVLNSNEATRDEGDSFDDMKQYAKDQGYNFSYVLDKNSVMADAFGATRTPELFLFDKNGKLVYHGAIDDNPNGPDKVTRQHAQLAMQEMVSGKTVSTATTRFTGCSIKRI
jgi:thioredoxin-related protein